MTRNRSSKLHLVAPADLALPPNPLAHLLADPLPDPHAGTTPDDPQQAPCAVLPPSVPVLPGTLLGLELLLQQQAFDLRSARDLLCEDPGALLHLFALVSEEHTDSSELSSAPFTALSPDRPARLEDCIASLSAGRLLRTLAQAGSIRREQAAYAHFARHSAAIGRYAQHVADALGLSREQALLIGTLHELGSLPAVLGWGSLQTSEREAVLRCEDLGRRYGLPRDLRVALDAVHRGLSGSIWVAVINAAHDLLATA